MNEIIPRATVETAEEGGGPEGAEGATSGGGVGKAFLRRRSGRTGGSVRGPRVALGGVWAHCT